MHEALVTGSWMGVGKRRKAADVYPYLDAYIARKERQIADILQGVERYEKKRTAEEQAYRSMSALRRIVSGRKPDHHLAVEYIHYVKKPMEQVRRLRAELEAARAILDQTGPDDMIDLSEDLDKEME